MHVGGLCGIAAAGLASLPGLAAAFSNTSPFVLLSESQSLRVGYNADLGPAVLSMNSALESIVNDAAMSCEYDAYIFVKQPHVSERDVNPRTMPWLTHAAKKVRESVLLGTVLDGSSAAVDSTAHELQQAIAAKCGAQAVVVDPETGAFDYYADTTARILSLDLSNSAKTPAEADTLMRDLVGHLPSANFLLAYRTTPVARAASDAQPDAQPSASPNAVTTPHSPADATRPHVSATQSHAAPGDELPYESVFRNYQFFSPGIFMGLIAGGLSLVILLVALKAVGSLQISLAAFEPRRQTAARKA